MGHPATTTLCLCGLPPGFPLFQMRLAPVEGVGTQQRGGELDLPGRGERGHLAHSWAVVSPWGGQSQTGLMLDTPYRNLSEWAQRGPAEPLSQLGHQGCTPLFDAVQNGHLEVVQLLIAAGPLGVHSKTSRPMVGRQSHCSDLRWGDREQKRDRVPTRRQLHRCLLT